MYGMRKDKLHLLPHDPVWIKDFFAEKSRIKGALGNSSAVIEHVGSTAIPRVHAKPILDIVILCDEKGIEPMIQALVGLGYEYRGAYGDQINHYYAILDRANVRFCQVHMFSEAKADWRAKLTFRDVLRESLELAHEYDNYKLELAKIAANKTEYAEMKSKWLDAFIIKVMNAASGV